MDPVFQVILVVAVALILPTLYLAILFTQSHDDSGPVLQDTPFSPNSLAQRLGVEVSSSVGKHSLQGERDGRRWTITLNRMDEAWGARVSVACALPRSVRVRPEDFFGGKDPGLGDPAFDSVVDLQGDPAWLSAAFSARARSDLLELQGRGGYRMQPDGISSGPHAAEYADILRVLEVTLRLGAALDLSPEEIPAALLERTRESRGDVARIAALRLVASFPSSEEARTLVDSRGRFDEDPAFTALSRAVTAPDKAEGRIINLLGHKDMEVRRAAVSWLHDHGTSEAIGALREASSSHIKEPIREAVRAIQGRLINREAGTLALVADPEQRGELALAEDEAGRLALARGRTSERS